MSDKVRVYVNYEESFIEGGGLREGEPDEPYSMREDSYYDYSVLGVTLTNTTPYHEDFLIPGPAPKQVYVVWVRYGDGDTFGHSNGHGCIAAVYRTEREAKRTAQQIKAGKWVNPSGYIRWQGYFNTFEGVHYALFDVKSA